MNARYNLRILIAAAILGFNQVRREKAAAAGQLFFLLILIVSYGSLFQLLPQEKLTPYHLTHESLTWYLAITEFMLFCAVYYWREIQNDIISGHVEGNILRPCAWCVLKMGEWSGQYLARVLMLAVPTMIITALVSDDWTGASRFAISLVTVVPLAAVIYLAASFVIGSAALWLGQADPIYWIWQRCMFFLGALLWPLAMYPVILQHFVWFTPFPAVFAASGYWFSQDGMPPLFVCLMLQMFWAVITIYTMISVNRRIERRIREGK